MEVAVIVIVCSSRSINSRRSSKSSTSSSSGSASASASASPLTNCITFAGFSIILEYVTIVACTLVGAISNVANVLAAVASRTFLFS